MGAAVPASSSGWKTTKVKIFLLKNADFDATITSHDFRTPPGAQLAAVVEVVASSTTHECDSTVQTLQPAMIAEKANPSVEKWSSLIGYLHARISDTQAVTDII